MYVSVYIYVYIDLIPNSLYLRNTLWLMNGSVNVTNINQARTIWQPCFPAAVDRDGTARAELAPFGAWATAFRPRLSVYLPLP